MINSIVEWFNGMTTGLQVYWGIALFASGVFLVQMVLTFIGIGDVDAETDIPAGDGIGDTLDTGGAMQLFTVRNVVNFLLGVGWGGVCFWPIINNAFLLLIVAMITGVVFVYLFVVLFKQFMKLSHDGAFRVQDCVGQVADVYLRIPGERKGEGKIQFSFQGSVQELPALTDGEAIPTGAKVRVLQLVGSNTLLVEQVK